MKAIDWIDLTPRAYDRPTVVRVRFSPTDVRYVVCGTQYGYLHTTSGEMRTWRSYSGARRVARAYVPF
jgi:hypothetical protein